MMEKDNISTYAKSDSTYVEQIGQFIRHNRLNQNKTQTELGIAAGINRSTLIQLEKGAPVNLLSLIQVLRALKQLHVLKAFEIQAPLSPLLLAAIQQKERKRAGKANKTNKHSKKQSDW